MVIVLSVMNGFDRELKSRILKVIPHGMVHVDQGTTQWIDMVMRLENHDGVMAASPLIPGKGLLLSGNQSSPVEISGVSPEYERNVSSIHDAMVAGKLTSIEEGFGIVLGQSLAYKLGVGVGDRVTIVLPQLMSGASGIYPRRKRLEVVGLFEVGADIDGRHGLVSLEAARKMFSPRLPPGAVNAFRVRTGDIHGAHRVMASVAESFADRSLQVTSWADTHRLLFSAIKMEKNMITVLMFFVVAVAAFNIISILVMMVAEKRSDIAILRVMGARPKTIGRIFLVQGLMTGLGGIVLGVVIGSLMVAYLTDIVEYIEYLTGARLFDPDVYYIAHLPTQWEPGDVILIVAVATLLTVLATLWPSWRAAQVDPVHSLNE
jgi:lipoprotein-releasing system permease protein